MKPSHKLYKVFALGFSLIELMIVIMIIGILAAIAIPSYQNYAKKARFTEIITTADFYKTAVALAIQQGYALAEITNGKHGVPIAPKVTKHLASLNIENGVITATGTDLVNNATYILTPQADGSQFTVSGTCLENGFCDV